MANLTHRILNLSLTIFIVSLVIPSSLFAHSTSVDTIGPDYPTKAKDINTGFDLRIRGQHKLTRSFDRSIITFSYPVDSPTYSDSIPIAGNEGPIVIDINHDISSLSIGNDTIVEVLVTVSSFLGSTRIDDQEIIKIYDMDFPVHNYQSDFDDERSDFARYGFTLDYYGDLSSKALHSWHSYGSEDSIECIFQKPIIVGDNGTIVRYNEILLLETGGDLTGSGINTDYVEVNASTDLGITWRTIKKYNSKLHQVWRDHVNSEPSDDLNREQIIELGKEFKGDTVTLQFVLHTDKSDHNIWGWSIDDFTVDQITSQDELPPFAERVQIAPNPTSGWTRLDFSLIETGPIYCRLYDALGRQVRDLLSEDRLLVGDHRIEVDLMDQPSGMLYITLSDGVSSSSYPIVKR